MGDTRQDGAHGLIMARIEAWAEQHAAHVKAGEGDGCGCDVYDDVIYGLSLFDPLDPPNLTAGCGERYALLDGSVLDGTEVRGGRRNWRIINPDRP